MPITYTNAKGKTYYLHQGTTKTGKPKYHFSPKSEGNLVETVPEGYEIYEHPNAQVFLRQIQPKIITDEERQVVEDGMRKYASVSHYKIDVKGNAILIYTAAQNMSALTTILQGIPGAMGKEAQIMEILNRSAHYSPVMQFELIDEERRTFAVQRYCYRGSIDDWIYVGGSGKLKRLVQQYVKHLDKESYYELF